MYTTPLSVLLPHRLVLFLMVLAMGSRLDLKQSQHERQAEKYHQLARAALWEVPVMDDTSIDAVHALVSIGLSNSIRDFRTHTFLPVLYGMVPPDVLRREENCGVCLGNYGMFMN